MIVPADLGSAPLVTDALGHAGFSLSDQPGIWIREERLAAGRFRAQIDLLVPEAIAGPGSRSADVGAHGKRTARRVIGLEGALVDHALRRIIALDAADPRAFDIRVAGPAALLVAKVHKISDRVASDRRRKDKDALDVLRILRAVETTELLDGLRQLLQAEVSAAVTAAAIDSLSRLFGAPRSAGSQMAARAVVPLEDPGVIAESCAALTSDLLAALSDRHPRITFTEHLTGRRAALRARPQLDVRYVVDTWLASDRDEARTAAYFELALVDVEAALAYYREFSDEIDAERSATDELAERERTAWRRGRGDAS